MLGDVCVCGGQGSTRARRPLPTHPRSLWGGEEVEIGWGGGGVCPAETSIKNSFTSTNQLIPSELDANNTPQQTSRDRSTSRRTSLEHSTNS